jgi:surfactin synthase thioesterase subunit
MLKIFMVAMRADFTAYELHTMANENPLPIPITAFAGTEDSAVTAASMAEWAMHTDAEFDLKMLPGGHFFPPSSIATVIDTIRGQVISRASTPVIRPAMEGTSACR